MSKAAFSQFERSTSLEPARLGDLGQELLAEIPAPERALAARLTVASLHRLAPGAWAPDEDLPTGRSPHGAFLLRGMIVRDVIVGGRASGHLFGPGDILPTRGGSDTSLPVESAWTCGSDGAVLAVADERLARVAHKWPGLSAVLQDRLTQQLEEAALRTAIASLPRAEQRVLALMWQLADRWGIVRPEGVVVRLQLTHELIGRLVGARRSTVSLALQSLADERTVVRAGPDSWRLAHGSNLMIERA